MLWTLHPLQTQAVTYIIQRAESLVSLMYLLTLWGFIRSVEPGASKGWGVLAWVACLLGMATKEVMVTAPVMVALYDRIFVAGSWREVWARRKWFHLSLALTWLLLAWLVVGTAGRGGTAGFGGGMSPWGYALTQVGAVAHYLRLALWPQPLVFDYGKDLVAGWSDIWWQALLLFSARCSESLGGVARPGGGLARGVLLRGAGAELEFCAGRDADHERTPGLPGAGSCRHLGGRRAVCPAGAEKFCGVCRHGRRAGRRHRAAQP